MMKKINSIIAISLVLTLLLVGLVSAFAVSSVYWEGKPVRAYPGIEKIVYLGLQNMVGEEDELVRAEIITGNNIATLKETEFLVEAGTKNTKVPIEIDLPKDKSLESLTPVTVSFKTVTQGQSGAITMGVGYSTTIDVLSIAEPLDEKAQRIRASYMTWFIIAAIIIAIATVTIIIKKKRKQAKGNSINFK